jgi:phosphate transport system protein
MSQHILHAFEDSMKKLKQDVMVMAGLTEQNVTNAVRGLLERTIDTCNSVIADDDAVDRLEKKIDRDGLEIIMKYSPVATDLRRVLTAMRIGQQLERVSDEAVSIARRARTITTHSPLPETQFMTWPWTC